MHSIRCQPGKRLKCLMRCVKLWPKNRSYHSSRKVKSLSSPLISTIRVHITLILVGSSASPPGQIAYSTWTMAAGCSYLSMVAYLVCQYLTINLLSLCLKSLRKRSSPIKRLHSYRVNTSKDNDLSRCDLALMTAQLLK